MLTGMIVGLPGMCRVIWRLIVRATQVGAWMACRSASSPTTVTVCAAGSTASGPISLPPLPFLAPMVAMWAIALGLGNVFWQYRSAKRTQGAV